MSLLASFMNLAGPDLIVILLIILVLFGAKKLPELARGMGQAVKEFQKAKDEFNDELHKAGKSEAETGLRRPRCGRVQIRQLLPETKPIKFDRGRVVALRPYRFPRLFDDFSGVLWNRERFRSWSARRARITLKSRRKISSQNYLSAWLQV